MSINKSSLENQLDKKVQELITLVENYKNWEEYVSEDCQILIKTIIKNKNVSDSLKELNIKYSTARARLIRSINRIKNKNTSFMRNAKTIKAKELILLTEKDGWQNNLTNYEIMIVKEFKQVKNLHETGRRLNMSPSNVYATLYGNSQKQGVLNKIKKEKLC